MRPALRYRHTVNVHNTGAAAEVVPYLVSLFHPKSVADVGCGLGSWLAVFEKAGITDYSGIDGDYVDRGNLYISPAHFIAADLEKPVTLNRRYDLVISLEVAEHLGEAAAGNFVHSLVRLSDIIIFSAAVPGQGGQHHLNEQWPSWWAEKFRQHGFDFYDILRDRFWDNSKVDVWYRQNMFLVTKPEIAEKYGFKPSSSARIHPDLFNARIRKIRDYEQGEVSLPVALSVFTRSLLRAIKKRTGMR